MAPSGYKPSARTEIARLQRSLDDLFDRARKIDPASEIAGDVSRYLCVRVAGFLEQSLLAVGRSACERMTGGIGRQFAMSWLERAPNPSKREVIRFVHRFSATWSDELDGFLSADERGDRLNALIGIRNDIAHGKNQGVSALQARGYYELALEVVEWMADRLEPKPGLGPASTP